MRVLGITLVMLFAASISAKPQHKLCPSACTPPATFTLTRAKTPYNGKVRFGREIKMAGNPMWEWIKVAEPPTPCTNAQIAADKVDKVACAAKIGDVLYVTPRFQVIK